MTGKHKTKMINGNLCIIQELLPRKDLKEGDWWMSSSGNKVIIIKIEDFGTKLCDIYVTYKWKKDGNWERYTKDAFNFQCRYCKIIQGKRHESSNNKRRNSNSN